MRTINVIGQGYIGLPTALMFAKSGYKVIGTDYNKKLIESLSNGVLSFEETGLGELFRDAIDNGMKFSTEYQKTDTYIITVPTPYIEESKKIDPSYVISAFLSVLDVCLPGAIIIIESTISPGSIDSYIRPEVMKRGLIIGSDVNLVHAPERIIPGNMLYELTHNSRTIGVDDQKIGNIVKELYSSFCRSEIVVTDIKTAEMTKVVENTYRDVNIAFANELAKICRFDNMDVYEIIRIANKHPRVKILQPGPGVGGHCISVDPWFLVGNYPDISNLIRTARNTNDSMPLFVLGRIQTIMLARGITDYSKIGIYGITYKENVSDIRESPTLQLNHFMNKASIVGVKFFDPNVSTIVVQNQIFIFDDFLRDIEVLVIMVGHDHIKKNMEAIMNLVILDTRNICDFPGVYKL